MASRNLDFSIEQYYHVYNRGTDKRDIFLDDADRQRFIKLLFIANGSTPFVFRELPKGLLYTEFDRGESITAIGAYCLMPNHFHLLLKETGENGISKFIGKVLTSYSSYFNKKYSRSGSLFEGTFKAKHLDSDEYLKYIFSYIHLNPVKLIDPNWKENGIKNYDKSKKYLNEYPYSSYLDYIGNNRLESKIINKDVFPGYFIDSNEFNSYVDDWLEYKNHFT